MKVVKDGRVVSDARPAEALAPEGLRDAFGIEAEWLPTSGGALLSMSRVQEP